MASEPHTITNILALLSSLHVKWLTRVNGDSILTPNLILVINDDIVIVTIVSGSRDRVILVFYFWLEGFSEMEYWSGWEFNTIRHSNLWVPHSIV